MNEIIESVKVLKKQQSLYETMSPAHEEKHKQRNGHARTATTLYIEERPAVESRNKPSNQLSRYKEKDEAPASMLLRELEELRE